MKRIQAIAIVILLCSAYLVELRVTKLRRRLRRRKAEITVEGTKNRTYSYNEIHIGSGGFGKVFKGKIVTGAGAGDEIALKEITITDKNKEALKNEIDIMTKINGLSVENKKYLLKMIDNFEKETKKYIVLPLMNKSLSDVIPGTNIAFWFKDQHKLIQKVIIDIAQGMKALNENKILYRDLKLENVMVNVQLDADGEPTNITDLKIIDFGLSKYIETLDKHTGSQEKSGTPDYMSPEATKGEIHGYSSDIWSWGCLVFSLMMYVTPFSIDEEGNFEYNNPTVNFGSGKNFGRLKLESSQMKDKDDTTIVREWIEEYYSKSKNDDHNNKVYMLTKNIVEGFKGISENGENETEVKNYIDAAKVALYVACILKSKVFVNPAARANWDELIKLMDFAELEISEIENKIKSGEMCSAKYKELLTYLELKPAEEKKLKIEKKKLALQIKNIYGIRKPLKSKIK